MRCYIYIYIWVLGAREEEESLEGGSGSPSSRIGISQSFGRRWKLSTGATRVTRLAHQMDSGCNAWQREA